MNNNYRLSPFDQTVSVYSLLALQRNNMSFVEYNKYLTPVDLCFGRNRFQSFPNSWSTDKVWPIAKAGFYFDKYIIKCFACEIFWSGETRKENIAPLHKPDCKFVQLFPDGHLKSWSEPCCYHDKVEKIIEGFPFVYRMRLKLFENKWPHSFPISKEEIARAGFFPFGGKDSVRCIYCKLIVGSWTNDGETPLETHLNYSPQCPFAKLVLCIFGDTAKCG